MTKILAKNTKKYNIGFMNNKRTSLKTFGKPAFWAFVISCGLLASSCSTNPATGDKQFTALMPAGQEEQIGATEHQKVLQQFGLYSDQRVQNYVSQVGARVVKNTERPDVRYKFFVLDSPIINAFALPGGYIYVSRGLLALANNEAELAAVLAHEAGHITARHSAERYSHGVLTSLGAAVLSAAVDNSGVSQALGVGSNLYLSSYSRGQENQADSLGLRYMSRAGYNTEGMASFLTAMQGKAALDARLAGQEPGSGFNYFSTHPATDDRVRNAANEAVSYPRGGNLNKDEYLNTVNGLVYGDSAKQGFVRGSSFYHTELDFTFSAPDGFRLINNPSQVIATSKDGSIIVFDMASNAGGQDPLTYLSKTWMKEEKLQGLERLTINNMPAATASFAGQVNGRPVTIRLVTIAWNNKTMARFQMAIPQGASGAVVEDLKRTTYSLRHLTAQEKQSLKPYHVQVVTADARDTAASLAQRQPFDTLPVEHFRTLNNLPPGAQIVTGQRYKIVVE